MAAEAEGVLEVEPAQVGPPAGVQIRGAGPGLPLIRTSSCARTPARATVNATGL